MTPARRYAPRYEESWALVVGINDYARASPLAYAVSDAQAVAESLDPLGFPDENVTVLLDAAATRDRILSELQGLGRKAGSDDRVLFFFAGHGTTHTGHRGEVGFLVPADGAPGDLHTLVRWDDLTRIAELIPAKHALFIMDACYGGLAVTRAAGGRQRFLKDMLSRYVRQVVAAGKADQVVADSGGPRPENSVFTGHLLDALDGAAASDDGTITANGAMAYVYDRVGRDTDSIQTPHFGCIDGDGDFVFVAPSLERLDAAEEHGQDILVGSPPGLLDPSQARNEGELTSDLKELLGEPTRRIKLDECVVREVTAFLGRTGSQDCSAGGGSISADTFAERLREYEGAASRLMIAAALLGKWSVSEQRPVLRAVLGRLADNIESQGGSTVLLALRWYPLQLVLYCGGIGAIAGSSYANLRTLVTASTREARTGTGTEPIVVPIVDNFSEYERGFRLLPGRERNVVPASEHLFEFLQPVLEDTLFLGRDYETIFDRFEVFLALIYADVSDTGFSPLGRFSWKHRSRIAHSPLAEILAEAKDAGGDWPPLQAGLFRGNRERFEAVAQQLGQTLGR